MNRSLRLALALLFVAGCRASPERNGPDIGRDAPIARSEPAVIVEPPPFAKSDLVAIEQAATEPTFPGLAETAGGSAPRIADVEITLRRSRCYGTCPVYTVRVRGDGSVLYEGKQYVLSTETVETSIDPVKLEPILREMEALDFMRHKHRCLGSVRDSACTGVELVVGKTSRWFVDCRYGRECGQDTTELDTIWHASIDRIGKLVDELVQSEQWIGTDVQRSAAFARDR